MDDAGFETALQSRIDEMLDACTQCGKCVAVCPSARPAGIADADPEAVISGVIDLLRGGTGSEASRLWASACTQSGACIEACPEGLNPRFLLAMARVTIAGQARPDRRRQAVENFRQLGRDVAVLSRLQLDDRALARLGQRPQSESHSHEAPDFVFYTGCNVLKTPHIALLALDMMDALGVSYRVMGGPSHCCGIVHLRAGDTATFSRMAAGTLDKLAQSPSGQVLAWCPSCYVQFTETTLPVAERQRGARPFEMTPFMRFLAARLDELRPLLRRRLEMRVALHRHPGVPGAMEAAQALLRAVPGVELVELAVPAIGLQSANLAVLPAQRRALEQAELEAAAAAGVDVLAAVYHSDHRELCAHERDWPFRIVNVLEILGASMDLHQDDTYKHLKLMQDADLILAECRDLMERHALEPAAVREVLVRALLGDQQLPLRTSAPTCR